MEYKKFTNVSKNSQQNNLETNTNEKYLKKGIYLRKKDKKVLIILILV